MFRKPNYQYLTSNNEVTDVGRWFDGKTLAEARDVIDELTAKYGAEARFNYNDDYYSGITFRLDGPYVLESEVDHAKRIAQEEADYQRQLRNAEHEINRAKKEGKL